MNKKLYYNACYAPVAQLDRVLGYEPNGREFESLRVHHIKPKLGSNQQFNIADFFIFNKKTSESLVFIFYALQEVLTSYKIFHQRKILQYF